MRVNKERVLSNPYSIEQGLGAVRLLSKHPSGKLPGHNNGNFIMALDSLPIVRILLASETTPADVREELKRHDLAKLRKKGAILLGKSLIRAAKKGGGGYPHEVDSLSHLLHSQHLTLKDLGSTPGKWRAIREKRIRKYNAPGRFQPFMRGRGRIR